MHVCGLLNWQQYTICYGMYQWFKMAKFMTYDPLYSIDFLQAKMPNDRYDNCTLYALHSTTSNDDDVYKWVKRFHMCSISNDNIYLNLSNGIFFILIIFSYHSHSISALEYVECDVFDVFYFLPWFRKQTSIFLPRSLSPSFSHSQCLLTAAAFRYRQEANIEKIEWKMGQLVEECIQHALWVCRCSSF